VLFNPKFPLFQGVYAARSEVEAARPHNACARQTIRRLVSLGFTLDVLKKSFGADPKYEIPSSVFLQDMTEVSEEPYCVLIASTGKNYGRLFLLGCLCI
jgi:hypothetical protein